VVVVVMSVQFVEVQIDCDNKLITNNDDKGNYLAYLSNKVRRKARRKNLRRVK